jgi:hypothetical protein
LLVMSYQPPAGKNSKPQTPYTDTNLTGKENDSKAT